MAKWLLVGSFVALASACVPMGRPENATRAGTRGPLHPVLAAYAAALDGFLTEEERAAMAAVDLGGTTRGDAQRLRYMAADRVVRTLLPMALEAQGRPELLSHAARLRALPPLLDRDTDAVATPAVRRALLAMRAPPRVGAASIDVLPTAGERIDEAMLVEIALAEEGDALAVAAEHVIDPEVERELAQALAEYADAYARTYGVSQLHADAAAAAAADAVDAGLLFEAAIETWGVPRERAIAEALDLLSDMAEAARRRERLPYVPRRSEPPIDPIGPAGVP